MENVEVFPKEKKAIVKINPKVFPLEVVYAACYVLLDKAYFILDGDPKKELKVVIYAKDEKTDKKGLEKIALSLHDELINYANFAVQAARNQAIREAIIKRALATNLGTADISYRSETLEKRAEEIKMKPEDMLIEDPEGIAQPWSPEKAEGLKKPDECKECESDNDACKG